MVRQAVEGVPQLVPVREAEAGQLVQIPPLEQLGHDHASEDHVRH